MIKATAWVSTAALLYGLAITIGLLSEAGLAYLFHKEPSLALWWWHLTQRVATLIFVLALVSSGIVVFSLDKRYPELCFLIVKLLRVLFWVR